MVTRANPRLIGRARRPLGVSLGLAFLLPFVVTPGRSASVDLTKGAATIVPASMNPGVKGAFGRPYEVRTRVTAVRFHVGGTPSTAPGGLSSTP